MGYAYHNCSGFFFYFYFAESAYLLSWMIHGNKILSSFAASKLYMNFRNSQIPRNGWKISIVLSTLWYFTYLYLTLWRTFQKDFKKVIIKALRDFTISSLDHFLIVLFDWSVFIPLASISMHQGYKDFQRKRKALNLLSFVNCLLFSIFCSVAEKRRKTQCNVTWLFHRWGWQVEAHCYITIREAGSAVPSALPSVSTTYCFSVSRTRQLLCSISTRRQAGGEFCSEGFLPDELAIKDT